MHVFEVLDHEFQNQSLGGWIQFQDQSLGRHTVRSA
jgi:hypothetical protein